MIYFKKQNQKPTTSFSKIKLYKKKKKKKKPIIASHLNIKKYLFKYPQVSA